jgi:predicted nucleic acid-binding protein
LIVLDASAAIEFVLRTGRAERIAARIFRPDERLHAPHLIDVEVAQVLRRLLHARQLSVQRVAEALDDYDLLAVERHAHRPLLGRIWTLRSALSAYDAAYVALAEALGATLLTCDEKLSRARGHGAQIETIGVH